MVCIPGNMGWKWTLRHLECHFFNELKWKEDKMAYSLM